MENPPKAEEYYDQKYYETHMKNLLKSIPFWKDDRVPDIFIATEVGGFNDGTNFIADQLKEKLGFDGYFSTENGIPVTDQDARGIDVVVFYKNNPQFKNISVKYHNIVAHLRELHKNEPEILKEIEAHKTRPVVEVIFDMGAAGNFHVFGNHWPSQGGGMSAARQRFEISEYVMDRIEEIKKTSQKEPYVLVTGDFNTTDNTKNEGRYYAFQNFENDRYLGDKKFSFRLHDLHDVYQSQVVKWYEKDDIPPGTYFYPHPTQGPVWNRLDRFWMSENLVAPMTESVNAQIRADIKSYQIECGKHFTTSTNYFYTDGAALEGTNMARVPNEKHSSDHWAISFLLKLIGFK